MLLTAEVGKELEEQSRTEVGGILKRKKYIYKTKKRWERSV